MEDNSIFDIIQHVITILKNEVGLAESSIRVIESRSFKPIPDYFKDKQQEYYSEALINDLDELYRKQLLLQPSEYVRKLTRKVSSN